MPLTREIKAFILIGILAAIAHYGMLVGLKEGMDWGAVPATLVGYLAGGVVSYILNRTHTFASQRDHSETIWRFTTVAGVGFCLTWAFMHLFVEGLGWHYLLSQVLTTGVVLVWSFLANKFWTFGAMAPP